MKQLVLPPTLHGSARLPASKSISARALVLGTMAKDMQIQNLSDADDTRLLRTAIESHTPEKNMGAAGTAMRFGTALFATVEGTHILDGTARMRERPIGILVDALRQLGADIDYLGKEGFPPLRIRGKKLTGGSLHLNAQVSSQYVSALLLIAPRMAAPLHLHLEGEVASAPYIEMTLQLLQRFGCSVRRERRAEIIVANSITPQKGVFAVENDWSGASYWYAMIALCPDPAATLLLPGLTAESLQGDAAVERLFRDLGVGTRFEAGGATLTKCAPTEGMLRIDFKDTPDLAQTFVVCAAMQARPFRFTGLASLRIKETDRLAALQNELQSLGIRVEISGDDTMTYDGTATRLCAPLAPIRTYDDHRMAMAFAPAAYRFPGLCIAQPEVVSKSYPNFWEEMEFRR